MDTNTTNPAALARIDADDKHAERVGLKLAEVLNLHPVKGFIPARYASAYGTKTAIGLARTVARILQSE